MTADDTQPCVGHGPVGEELRLLLLALLDRYEPAVRSVLAGLRVEAAEHEGATRNGDTAGSAPEPPPACQSCPVCSVISLIRGDRPELGGRVAEQGEGLLSALRILLDQPWHEPQPAPRPQPPTGRPEPSEPSEPPEPPVGRQRPKVERIEVSGGVGGC